MTYDEAVEALQTMFEVPINDEDENFLRIIPRAFEYASNRIYRDMRNLTAVRRTTATFTVSNRELLVPQSVIIVYAVNAVTSAGVRSNLERISVEALDIFWPNPTLNPGLPDKYAIIGNGTLTNPYIVLVMPTPNLAYTAEFIGPVRPPPLSQTNTQTYLSVILPDLHLAACSIFLAGYQRDFQQAVAGYEAQYKELLNDPQLESTQQN